MPMICELTNKSPKHLLLTYLMCFGVFLSACQASPKTQAGASTLPLTSTNLSMETNQVGAILDSTFAGLSYEKARITTPLFSPTNTNLISLFKLLGPGILRIGGNSVDQMIWNPSGAGATAGETASSEQQTGK